jgi:hypothetical protein
MLWCCCRLLLSFSLHLHCLLLVWLLVLLLLVLCLEAPELSCRLLRLEAGLTQ